MGTRERSHCVGFQRIGGALAHLSRGPSPQLVSVWNSNFSANTPWRGSHRSLQCKGHGTVLRIRQDAYLMVLRIRGNLRTHMEGYLAAGSISNVSFKGRPGLKPRSVALWLASFCKSLILSNSGRKQALTEWIFSDSQFPVDPAPHSFHLAKFSPPVI